jgi:NADH-quinone oxidoreductase subunit L
MKWPLYILAVASVLGGIINLPGIHWLTDWLSPVLHHKAELYTWSMGIFATLIVVSAGAIGYLGYRLYSDVLLAQIKAGEEDPAHYYLGDIWKGFEMGWGLDYVYQRLLVRPYRAFSQFLSEVFDRQAIDGILVEGSAGLVGKVSQVASRAQNGSVRTYALVFLIGVVIIVGYVVIGA